MHVPSADPEVAIAAEASTAHQTEPDVSGAGKRAREDGEGGDVDGDESGPAKRVAGAYHGM